MTLIGIKEEKTGKTFVKINQNLKRLNLKYSRKCLIIIALNR